MIRLEQRMLKVDGATLEVFLGGGPGPLLCDTHPFAPATDHLAEDDPLAAVRLVRVNGRGSGHSSPGRTAQEHTIDQFLVDLEAVRQQLGGEPWIYMGYSAGGYTGLRYALHYPQALRGLIIGFCTANVRYFLADPRSIFSPANPANQQLLASAPRPRVADTARDGFGWAPVRDDVWVLYEQDHPVWVWPNTPPEQARSYVLDMVVHPVDDRLDAVAAPTLIFAGRHDPVGPWHYVEPLRGIPGSEFVLLECGHVDMREGHGLAEYHAAIRRFLMERMREG